MSVSFKMFTENALGSLVGGGGLFFSFCSLFFLVTCLCFYF